MTELRQRRRGPPLARSPLGGRTAVERCRGGALTMLEPQICARWVISGGLHLVRSLAPDWERGGGVDGLYDDRRSQHARLVTLRQILSAHTGGSSASSRER
jgi:hypothetical protein